VVVVPETAGPAEAGTPTGVVGCAGVGSGFWVMVVWLGCSEMPTRSLEAGMRSLEFRLQAGRVVWSVLWKLEFRWRLDWELKVGICLGVVVVLVRAGPAEAGTPTWEVGCGRIGFGCLGDGRGAWLF